MRLDWFRSNARMIESRIFRFFHQRRLEIRLSQYSLDTRHQLRVMTVDCGDETHHSNLDCSRMMSLYGGFYSQLFRGDDTAQSRYSYPLTMHGIDLHQYQNYNHYRRDLGKRSSFFLRHAKKALKSGCKVDQFNPANHSLDMLEIHRSMKIRSFGVVMDAWSSKVSKFGGIPDLYLPIAKTTCSNHWEKYLGVFVDCLGYQQGSLRTDQKLIGYARLHRIGNMLAYKDYLGHGNFLDLGIMKLLHTEIVKWVMDSNDPDVVGIENIAHGSIERGNEGLFFWKKKALFEPFRVKMIEPELPIGFDAQVYLAHNPDVYDSNLSPELHYKIHGRFENRHYRAK